MKIRLPVFLNRIKLPARPGWLRRPALPELPMLDPWMNRWNALAPRERKLLRASALVLGIVVGYLALWAPWQRQLSQLRLNVPQDRAKLETMRQQAQQIAALRAQSAAGGARGGNLLAAVEQTAQLYGLRGSLTRIEPDGPTGARLSLQNASFNAILVWLNELQNRQGVRVESADFEGQAAPGMVNGRIVLRQPLS